MTDAIERKAGTTESGDSERRRTESEHPYKSGERAFTEPDNPPAKEGDSESQSPKKSQQETGGPGKPTA